MGEMADFFLDSHDIFDEWDMNDPWAGGEYPARTCKCCGKSGLHWEQIDQKWRLFEPKGLHICPINPLKERKALAATNQQGNANKEHGDRKEWVGGLHDGQNGQH